MVRRLRAAEGALDARAPIELAPGRQPQHSMMVGTGIFITLPALMDTLKGPQAMIGWVLGGLIALADGMVWSELAAAFPGSGGTYHFYDAAYGKRVGRSNPQIPVRLAVLLQRPARDRHAGRSAWSSIWATSCRSCGCPPGIGGRSFPESNAPVAWGQVGAMGVMVLVTALAYRRISVAARLMVVLWVGMLHHRGLGHRGRLHALECCASV